MTLQPGARLGPYEVVSPLGAGGMGEVYRATDTHLKRQVAIKVLPASLATDADRLARFQREAEVLAALNHPNIATVHGLERDRDFTALVMELVEGDDLADRIARGPIPLDEALAIAKQIAVALEAAHERGIIHRDLKPANIKVRADGTVKVLDFGLAKALDQAGEPGRAAGTDSGQPAAPTLPAVTSPTLTSPALMTGVGVLLGTAAYMAPEQAKGRAVDRRADIWAFGCVLYEMLTGRRAFDGDDVSELIVAVLTHEPDWSRLPAATPRTVHTLLRRCLQKDPQKRLPHLGLVRIELDEVGANDTTQPPIAPRASRRQQVVAAVSLIIAAVSLGALGLSRLRSTPARASDPELHLDLVTPPTTQPGDFTLSPDASRIVFVATDAGRPRLWLRLLGSDTPRVLPGTEGASRPFWSADGKAVGFFSDARLKRIDVDSDAVRTLASATYGTGGSWNRDGTILFSPVPGRPVLRVPSEGGVGMPVRHMDGDNNGQSRPMFLPDGRHFLFRDARGAWIGDIDGGTPRLLIDGAQPLGYVDSGYVLFLRAGTSELYAQRFDPERQALSGSPIAVLEHGTVQAASVAGANAIAYRDDVGGGSQLMWFDRGGLVLSKVPVSAEAPAITMPAISPDGARLAVGNLRSARTSLWMLDVRRGVMSAFVSGAGDAVFPVWSPDGRDVVFDSTRNAGVHNLYRKASNGVGDEQLILQTDQDKMPTDWSPDGRHLLYYTFDLKTQNDIWALSLGDGRAFPLATTTAEERDGKFSPDGRWMAYVSNESGQFEVYVQPFPGPGGRTRVSTAGGAQPQWRRDGRELFYMGLDGRLMAVAMSYVSGAESPTVGAPQPLFQAHVFRPVEHLDGAQYVVSPDGQRFLVNTSTDAPEPPPIHIILNWHPPSSTGEADK